MQYEIEIGRQEAFNTDAMAFLLREAEPYYEYTLRTEYRTTLPEIVAPPVPGNNPLSRGEIYPGLAPIVDANLGRDANAAFLSSLNLDPQHIPNYDPVYLNALKDTYPQVYEQALSLKEGDAGAGDLILKFFKFLPYD